jgi:hypothetical protein
MEYKYKTRFCPVLETGSIRFPRVSYGLPPCTVCPTTGVPVPSNIIVAPGNSYAVITFNFNFVMSGLDHFLIKIMNANEETEVFTVRFQQATQYIIPNLVNYTTYYAIITPVINQIRYAPGITGDFTPSI